MNKTKSILLNASNMDSFPVYPYAFIQVPAVARQFNIEVFCKDLIGIPQDEWKQVIQSLIANRQPDMILITLRNTDSLNAQDYEKSTDKRENRKAYFPIERTKELINIIREITDLKIVVGGFGFSVMPTELMHYLQPDLGVIGDPDPFFAHYFDIHHGDYKNVSNLTFFQDRQLITNPVEFYPPLADAEYSPEVVDEMMAFYEMFPSPGFQGAPLEIMRGCIHRCVFCSEHHVKGRKVRYRDLSAVLKDVEILSQCGITKLYIISSELNPEENDFVLEFADQIQDFNKTQPENQQLTWFGANYLLKFSNEDYKRLDKSGFTGGWFDITALDDANALAMRTPYRNKLLIKHLDPYAKSQRTRAALQASSKEDLEIGWTMFLGNPATTLATIRNTLQTANEHGIDQLFNRCGINFTTRVFDYEEPDPATLNSTYTVKPDLEQTSYQQIYPSFAYPPTLLQHFGSEKEIKKLFQYIGETFLSKRYQKTRNWHKFIVQHTSATILENWIDNLSNELGVDLPDTPIISNNENRHSILKWLFMDAISDQDQSTKEDLAKQAANFFIASFVSIFSSALQSLGLPNTIAKINNSTPFELATTIFRQWETEGELIHNLVVQTTSIPQETIRTLCQFFVQALLYKYNIVLAPKYKGIFLQDGISQTQ